MEDSVMTIKINATEAQVKYGLFSMELRFGQNSDENVIVFYNLKLVNGEKGIRVYPAKKGKDEKAGYRLNFSNAVMECIIKDMTARGWKQKKEESSNGGYELPF